MPEKIARKVGRPSLHGERKKSYSVTATKLAWDGLKEMAASSGLSLSEFLETLGRTKRLP
ncbi:MAG: ribbon-helix-helix domain-containing protein [Moorea sp. SIO3G5]|nr:ribbon-helix-helix domain-containing protein [Moorena sp. SIO3G5]